MILETIPVLAQLTDDHKLPLSLELQESVLEDYDESPETLVLLDQREHEWQAGPVGKTQAELTAPIIALKHCNPEVRGD
jgi:hypothetical protein